jgi:small GTP-binding protein
VHQATKGAFNHNYMMTQGCEYSVKDVKLDERGLYNVVELHLIDIAGQMIFKEITFDLCQKANQVMLVYDVTNPDSFQLVRTWYDSIKAQNPGKQFTGVVVANKVDLEQKHQVYAHDGQEFARSIGFAYIEVSALHSKNIEDPFKALANSFFDKYQQKVERLK